LYVLKKVELVVSVWLHNVGIHIDITIIHSHHRSTTCDTASDGREKCKTAVSLILICSLHRAPKTNESQTSRFCPVLTSWNISPTAVSEINRLSKSSGGELGREDQRHVALLSIFSYPIKLYLSCPFLFIRQI